MLRFEELRMRSDTVLHRDPGQEGQGLGEG